MKPKEKLVSEDYLRGLIKEISMDLTERDLARVVGYSLNLRASRQDIGEAAGIGRGTYARLMGAISRRSR